MLRSFAGRSLADRPATARDVRGGSWERWPGKRGRVHGASGCASATLPPFLDGGLALAESASSVLRPSRTSSTVGIVANPASGRDIRRLVSQASVFPDRRGATVTGLAAGLVALGRVPAGIALRRQKLLRVATSTPGQPEEIALVDACVSSLSHVGARALWQPGTISELAVTFAEPDAIGLSSVAGLLHPVGRQEPQGLLLRLAPPRSAQARMTVAAPIAPGLIAEVGVAALEVLVPGRSIALQARSGTLALDGERELEFSAAER